MYGGIQRAKMDVTPPVSSMAMKARNTLTQQENLAPASGDIIPFLYNNAITRPCGVPKKTTKRTPGTCPSNPAT
jgi:hypothetical protein